MTDIKTILDRVADRVTSPPDALEQLATRLERRKGHRRIGVAVLGLLVAAFGMFGLYLAFRPGVAKVASSPSGRGAGRCESLIPACHMKRQPDRWLTGDQRLGVFGRVHQVPDDLIGFDEALMRAWSEDPHAASSVQVTLGSADPSQLKWHGRGSYFYVISWIGTCELPIGGRIGGSPEPCASGQTWFTVIDASTGEFVFGSNQIEPPRG